MCLKVRQNYNNEAYLFILPAFILLGVLNLYPIIRNLYLSFTAWDMVIGDPVFIGIENYKEIFKSEEFYKSLKVTVMYTITYVPITLILGFLTAVLLVKKSKINIIYRTIFFTPHVTSMVAMSAVFLFIYHPQYGTLNTILKQFGGSPVRWLNSTDTALISLVMMNVWKSIGFAAIVYLGSILNIPKEVEEAADIDGASWWKKLMYIRIPLVSPTTFMLIIMFTIECFKVFTQISVMTGGGPDGSTTNILTYMYIQAFNQFRVGYGSAITIILLVCVLIVSMIQMSFERFVNYD